MSLGYSEMMQFEVVFDICHSNSTVFAKHSVFVKHTVLVSRGKCDRDE